MGNFIVIEIGCLHCMIPSSLVGRFDTREEAKEFISNLPNHLEIEYEIFDLNVIEETIDIVRGH